MYFFCQSRNQGKTLNGTDSGCLKIKRVSGKMKDETLTGPGEGELTFLFIICNVTDHVC